MFASYQQLDDVEKESDQLRMDIDMEQWPRSLPQTQRLCGFNAQRYSAGEDVPGDEV